MDSGSVGGGGVFKLRPAFPVAFWGRSKRAISEPKPFGTDT